MPTTLPLAETHARHGAVMRESCGWLLPAHYGDPALEYRAVREGAGLADRSPVGKAAVTGRDRAAFLHGMLSNDIKGLKPGQGCPAALLDAHGKVMSLLSVYALEDRLLLELPPGSTEKTLQVIDHFLISEKASLEPADEAFSVLSLQGPGAGALLERLAGGALTLAPYAHAEVTLGETAARIIHRAEGAPAGFQCWTAAAAGAALWETLVAAGARPVGVEAWEVLRVEAGIPLYGHDVDETVILPETRLEHLVSYTKGCYIGQEVVARVKYRGHVNRALAGLILEGERVPAHGARILVDGTEIGRVTSAVRSLALGTPIALGYVRREHLDPGTALTVAAGDAQLPARVAALPFVQ
ncbi:MAG: aminomethyl transferase family protein [Candidatus Rokubacteria bacterium]|nr:aminomethyl transferase family protein [Candidatus Rokubacteria bacterium]